MTIDFLKRCLLFLFLCLAQVLVFNRIQLFGFAMPLPYVFFVISFRRRYPRWASLLWAFFMGLLLDMAANTPGITMASLTLLAFIQPAVLELFVPHDTDDDCRATMGVLGTGKFFSYALLMTLVFCVVFFSLEAFSYFNLLHWAECVLGSTVLTLILVMALGSWGK